MTSRNEIKLIRSLKLKKYRNKENKFLVEGVKNVLEVLHSEYKVHNLYVTEKTEHQFSAFQPKIIGEKTLSEISSFKNNSTCLAVVEIPEHIIEHIDNDKHVFLLDGISDPGNMGTIIRSLDWFGFKQLICSMDCADLYNPKTISASMGSFIRVRTVYTDLKRFLSEDKRLKYGMVMEGNSIQEVKSEKPAVFILGSESHGIRPEILQLLDRKITIPAYGKAESLNVAIAASILCYQLSL